MKKILFTLSTALIFSITPAMAMDAASISKLINARSAFDNKSYDDAIKYYEELLDKDVLSNEDRNEALYRLGVCYENEDEPRDAAYFYGEYVRINRINAENYKQALYKAGEMNLVNATGRRDQSYARFAVVYFNTFIELFPTDERATKVQDKIDFARDLNAEYHYSQFGKYYFRHENYCGAFIAFEDSLAASDKFTQEILAYAKECQSDKTCRQEVQECSEKFELSNIAELKVFKFSKLD